MSELLASIGPTEIRTVGVLPPLRLLHVVPLPPPWSGIGVSFGHFVSSAPIRRQANWVVNTSPGEIGDGPPRTKLPTPGRVGRHLGLAVQVARMTRRHRTQIAHLHGSSHDLSFVANWLSIVAARAAGARVVWHLHQDLDVVTFPGQGILTRRTFAALMRAPDALAVLTEKDRRAASALVDPKKIVVLPPASSPDLLTLPLDRPDDDVRVLYVGWLTPAKGIHDLLQVALAVRGREHGSRISFWVPGTGRAAGEAEAVRAFVRRHGLESQVHLCGVVTGEAKRRMFARSHVLMMPTHRDAFPVAVLEGMAAGLPILATNVGGLPYMVEDGRGGYLTDVENVRQMTDRLVELAGDRRQRLTMGRANRERFAAELHPDRLALRALDVYRRVLERSPERVRRSPSRPRPTGPDDVSTPSTWPASTPDITRRG